MQVHIIIPIYLRENLGLERWDGLPFAVGCDSMRVAPWYLALE